MVNVSHDRESMSGELGDTMLTQVSHIAIADDDPESLALLRLALASPTTEIREATNGVELVRLLVENGPFDLVISDVMMPWLEGLQVLRTARGVEDMTPVLLITGLARPGLEAMVDSLGNAKLLRKPFGILELRAAVSDLMTVRRLS